MIADGLLWMAAGALLEGIWISLWLKPWKRTVLVDPVGWDEDYRRCHDVTPQPGGHLLHHSTCWCRVPASRSVTASKGDSSL